jgi:hypothetical protein
MGLEIVAIACTSMNLLNRSKWKQLDFLQVLPNIGVEEVYREQEN